MQTQDRNTALDGIRGLAALAVVINHCMVVSPVYYRANWQGAPDGLAWWVSNTPVHALWAAPGPVFLFFVLSGYVLTLPVLRRGSDWLAYYPKRMVRLLVPMWSAIVIAAALALPERAVNPALSSWANNHAIEPSPTVIVKHALTVGAPWLNSPLWSLRWELLFSLLLPVYIWVAHGCRRHLGLAITATILLVAAGGALGSNALTYMPMFALGSLLCARSNTTDVLPWTLRTKVRKVMVVVLGVTLLNATWWSPVAGVAAALSVLGATVLVWRYASARPGRVLTSPVVRWLGVVSFSLYLIHEPLLMTLVFHGGIREPWLLMLVGVPVALLAAQAFYRIVEMPSMRLAKWAGHVFTRPRDEVAVPIRTP